MYLNTRIFPTTHVYKARARRNGTGCLFQFTYCEHMVSDIIKKYLLF